MKIRLYRNIEIQNSPLSDKQEMTNFFTSPYLHTLSLPLQRELLYVRIWWVGGRSLSEFGRGHLSSV